MARRALRRGRRETCGHVVRHRAANRLGPQEVVQVAIRGVAVGVRQGIRVGAGMAGSTGRRQRRHVRSDQSESGHAVIERGAGPTCRGMAIGAVGRGEPRTGGGMYRSGRLIPLRQVAIRISALPRPRHR